MNKYLQNSDIAELLLTTDENLLVEYAPHGDCFWGVDKAYVGQNWLGNVLMEVREVLRICNLENKNNCAVEYLKDPAKKLGL